MNKRRFFSDRTDLFLFRESSLMIVAAVVSLLLQVISFLTTLNGAKAYFESVSAVAPLFFALAVQAVVYFLENGIRRKVTFLKIIALTLAIFCSSYFSFIGIYSNINPPERYLAKTYASYQSALSGRLDELAYSEKSSAYADVNRAVNAISLEYTENAQELNRLTALSEEIDAARAEASTGLSAPRRYDYYYYEDYAAAYAAYVASLSQSGAEEQRGKINALLEKYGVSDSAELSERLARAKSKESLIERTLGAEGDEVYSALGSASERIMSGEDGAFTERVFALYRELSGESLRAPDISSEEAPQLVLPEFSELSVGKNAAELREELSAYVAAACDTVNSFGGSVTPDDYTFENVYTLPIYALKTDFGTDAAVSLALAVLVDVLSLLFAMIFVRDKSILFARDTSSAASMRTELFEQNVLTAVRMDSGSLSAEWTEEEVAESLCDFVGKFATEDSAAQRGYSLIAERNALSSHEMLTAFLCQFGMAKTISAEESQTLTNGVVCTPCVLLKTKFLLWISENFGGVEKKREVAR